MSFSEPVRRSSESRSSFNKRHVAWVQQCTNESAAAPVVDLNHIEYHPEEQIEDDEANLSFSDSDIDLGGVPVSELQTHDAALVQTLLQEGGNNIRSKRRKGGRPAKDKGDGEEGMKRFRDYSSPVWVFFDLDEVLSSEAETTKIKLKCRMCSTSIVFNKSNGQTSNLLRHVSDKHGPMLKEAGKIAFRGGEPDFSMATFDLLRLEVKKQRKIMQFAMSAKDTTLDQLNLAFVSWIISADVPLNKFRDRYFLPLKDVIATLSKGKVKLPGVSTMLDIINLISFVAEESAIASIKKSGSVAMAIDMWTSLAKDHYMGSTYHWIDKDFNLRSQVVDLYPFFGSATGDMIARVVEDRFSEQFQNDAFISAIVSDCGANVKLARQLLVPGDSEDCLPHKLNCAVLHVTSKGDNGHQHVHYNPHAAVDLGGLQWLMAFFRNSQDRMKTLESYWNRSHQVKKCPMPILGGDTRWWGKRLQVARLKDLKDTLMEMKDAELAGLADDEHLPADFLSDAYWVRINAYERIFNVFYNLEVSSQAEKTETKSLIVNWVMKAQEALRVGHNAALAEAQPLWKSFLDSFNSTVVPLVNDVNNTTNAYLLNPLNYVVTDDSVELEYLDELEDDCWRCIVEEALDCCISHEKNDLEGSGIANWEQILESQKATLRARVSTAIEVAQSLIRMEAKNLNGDLEAQEAFSLLEFWKKLSEMRVVNPIIDAVKAILCIPASAAGPERLFSLTGRLVSKARSSFKPETIGVLAKAHSFLRSPPPKDQSWHGKRKYKKDPSLAQISSKRLKEMIDSVDPAQEMAALDRKEEERLRRRRRIQEEWEVVG